MHKLSLRTKLYVPLAILSLIIIFFSSITIYENFQKVSYYKKLKKETFFMVKIAALVHNIQEERGLTTGYLDSGKFKEQLIQQRKRTNKSYKQIISYIQSYHAAYTKNFANIIAGAVSLDPLRRSIDSRTTTTTEAFKRYSQINREMLHGITVISNDFYQPDITKQILAYTNLLYLTEYRGKERANGLLIVGQPDPSPMVLKHFAQNIAVAKEHEHLFLQYADIDETMHYKKLIRSTDALKIDTIEKEIFQHNHTLHTDPQTWFKIMTRMINHIDKIGTQIQSNLKTSIIALYNQSQNRFAMILVLSFLTLVVVSGAIYIFSIMIKEEKLKQLISQKYIISSMTDRKGNIIDVSQAFCDISGYTREELIGKPHNIVRHPETPKEVFKEMWSKLKKGKSWSGKVKNRTKDGDFYWVYANIEPFFDQKGNIVSYISTRIDITEQEMLAEKFEEERRKRMETEAMMAQQSRLAQMGEMLSMIAHQWRQPLAAISATSGTIYLNTRQPECNREAIASLSKKITVFTQHLSTTIEDFRNFFKPNKTKVHTDFKTITQRVINIIESSLINKNIDLHVEVKEVVSFENFENELMQVILNLIKNAEDALIDNHIENPRITVLIDGRTIRVCDNAGGIDNAIIDKIYDPYFSTKMQKDGTGLGLYMSKIIIEKNCGGKLLHENKDGGVCFTVIV